MWVRKGGDYLGDGEAEIGSWCGDVERDIEREGD